MAFYIGDRMPEWQGDVFVGALAQEHVARLTLEGGKVVNEKRLFEGVARFRDVRQGRTVISICSRTKPMAACSAWWPPLDGSTKERRVLLSL